MKFPTKVLTLSLVCMNMVVGGGPNYRNQIDTNMAMKPEDSDTNYRNYDTNMNTTPEKIKELKEYKDLDKACKKLNNLLDNGAIENFIEIPSETATEIDNAIRNILELIFPKDKIYSSEYWIQKIIENPKDDCKKSKIKKFLDRPQDYIDSMDTGLCDSTATKVLYLLTPYLNGDKKSNIDARSVFGQMMLKLTTKEDLKKMALRMIFASFFSGTRESDNFLSEYELEINPYTLYKSARQNPNKHKIYNLYFEDKKLEDFIKIAKDRYTYIYNNY